MVQCVVMGVRVGRRGGLEYHYMGEAMGQESGKCNWVVHLSRKMWVGRDMR